MKLAFDDIKAFCFEVATPQPGPNTNIVLKDWLWGNINADKLLLSLRMFAEEVMTRFC